MKNVFFLRKNNKKLKQNDSKVRAQNCCKKSHAFGITFAIITLIIATILIVFFSVGGDTYARSYRVISEYRDCLFYLKSEDFVATFTSGKREKDFYYDGVHTRLVPYGVLVVKYGSNVDINGVRNFVILIDSMQYTGRLEYNPIDGTFVNDIGVEISQNSDIYLRIWGGGVSDQAHMYCVSKDYIGYKNALKIALDSIGGDIQKYESKRKLNGEFFIKFVGTESLEEVSYYVLFVGDDKTSIICLIDAFSGAVKLTKVL